jgi:HAD superfamily hydrolase (TIGR01484 family)
MKITQFSKIKHKKLIVFDLDGTLAPTKAPMDREMDKLITQLLAQKKVAIIGGGKWELFKHQFLNELTAPKVLYKQLFMFPTTGTTFLHYQGGWKRVYEHKLSASEVKKIYSAIHKVLKDINYQAPKKTYGKIIENRGSQVTWSALGQDVVKVLGQKGILLKNQWRDKHTPIKLKIAKRLKVYLPNLEIHSAGHTSIDITKKGIDKAYGIRQMEKYLKIKIQDMLFVGDAIFPGGNDYAALKSGVDYVKVNSPADTKTLIISILNS